MFFAMIKKFFQFRLIQVIFGFVFFFLGVQLVLWIINMTDPERYHGEIFKRRVTKERFLEVRQHLRINARLQYGEMF